MPASALLSPTLATALTLLYWLVVAGFVIRVLLRDRPQPSSRIAWIAVIVAFPVVGILANLLFGEVRLGRRRGTRYRQVEANLPPFARCRAGDEANFEAQIPPRYEHLFATAQSVSKLPPVGGNSATLFEDSNATIDALVADIDAAQEHVHLVTYIWLRDGNGMRVAEALERAANRGVRCRAIADHVGSLAMVGSGRWKDMRSAGVALNVAMPIDRPLLRTLWRRLDLRNHRKIAVIDDRVTYSGSQNLADAEFRIKSRYAPWVDAVMRFEGPIARQNQHLFAVDWMAHVDEDLSELLARSVAAPSPGFVAQAIGSGPTTRYSAVPEMFEALIDGARRRLIVTTPYYVPDEGIQSSLCAASYRGVDVSLVFPARNDSKIVGAASRSYYLELLEAGVKIFEYRDGLLHAKTLTLDGEVALIGSANIDRRSFGLNFENSVLLYDPETTSRLVERQLAYIATSRQVTLEEVRAWSPIRRIWNNSLAMLGPLL